MGLISFLFGKRPVPIVVSPAPAPAARQQPSGPVRLAGTGEFDFEVVGESFYQGALDSICGGKCEDGHEKRVTATLRPEPNNLHDRNAVAVVVNGQKVAHLSREDARDFHRDMKRLGLAGKEASCRAVITGGWARPRKGGRIEEGHYGVELDLDWPLERA